MPPINAGELVKLINLWLFSVGFAFNGECVCWYGCSWASDETSALSSLNARRWWCCWCWAAEIWSIICGRGTVLFNVSNVENASWWVGCVAVDGTIVGSMGSDVLRIGDVGRCKCIRLAAAAVVVVTVGNVISIELCWLCWCGCCCCRCCRCDCDCVWWWFTLVSSKSKCTNNSSVFIETEERKNAIHTVNINTTASFQFAALMHTTQTYASQNRVKLRKNLRLLFWVSLSRSLHPFVCLFVLWNLCVFLLKVNKFHGLT